jgi:hypothetical protein
MGDWEGINTKLPGPCSNEENRHKPQSVKKEEKKKKLSPHNPTVVVSLLFGIIFWFNLFKQRPRHGPRFRGRRR